MRTSERPALSSNPALNVVKTIGSSGIFLAAAVCLSSYLVLYIVYLFLFSNSIFDLYRNLFSLMPETSPAMPQEMPEMVSSMMRGMLTGIMAVAMVPAILTLIGMWLHYATCRSMKNGGIATSGLTLWKVVRYIKLIFMCLYGVFILFICFLGIFMGGLLGIVGTATGENEAQTTGIALFRVYLVFFLIVAAFLVSGILYSVFQLKLLQRTGQVSLTGIPDGRVSRFVIVMNYILAVCIGINALLIISLSFVKIPFPEMGGACYFDFRFFLPGGAAGLALSAFLVLTALCLSRYGREMGGLAAFIAQPSYPAAMPQNYR